ncbi:LysR family transcriptional regulator [Amycolatopsis sp. NBRC 101858]|uniref:LysR family transcriptional regulator n=1 Tax=Amycolatopsis sp. NBRC 101858 TaxID=3032200 RepID=UPI0024A50C79|nr:LysR family transcriptional regulator [Amycolatopsis sp. NBRC 101858]GLY36834.1 LysR family transcriptional regulator [Amycolatopsis sp. NBRC 101858]
MELRQLAVVVAVAEEGGFTAAAQRLRTVQSTVSTVVRALERDLGTPLFHRTTHRVVLTPAGEAFMPAARAALEAVARARAAVSPVCGRVRLGVCPGLLADWHRALAALRGVHPGLVVEVRQVRAGDAAPAESTVDVVLTEVAGGADRAAVPSAELVTTPLPREELVLATAPGGSPFAPADLSELSLVDFPPGWAIRAAADRAFPCRRRSLEVDDLAVAAGLVRAGLAACVLPASAASRFADLTVRRFDRPPPWQLAAVHRGDPSPAVAALLAQLG